jgi:hypothetical protein
MNQSESKSDAMLLLDVPFEILRLTEDCTNRSGNSYETSLSSAKVTHLIAC